MSHKRSPIDRMERQNPVPPHSDLVPPDGRLEKILTHERDRDLADPDARVRGPHQPVLVAAAVVLAVGVAVGGTLLAIENHQGTVASPGSPSDASFSLPPTDPDVMVLPPPAASPGAVPTAPMLHFVAYSRPVSPKELLHHLSDRALQQPSARGTGPYAYMKTRGWYLSSDQTTDGTVTGSQTSIVEREQWRAEDGAGRVDDTENGATRSDMVGPDTQPHRRVDADTQSAPVLRDRLLSQGSGRSTRQWFGAFTDNWTVQIVSPGLQSAYLGILAEQPDIEVLGAVTDRVGRAGIAVSTRTDDMQLVLVFDETTGALLDYEQIALTAAAAAVPISLPSTVSYVVWLDDGYVQSVGDRP